MATKTTKKKSKKKPAKKPAARVKHENDDDPNFQPGPQPEPIDPFASLNLEDLFDSISEPLYEKYGYRSKAELLAKEVGKMRAELAIKEAELRHELGPMLGIFQSLTNAAAGEDSAHYDESVKRILRRIRLKAKEHGYGPEKPTGAKPWVELQKNGATDEQLTKNLKSINEKREDDYYLDGNVCELSMIAGDSDIAASILKGAAQLIPEVRRIMAIPRPTKAASKPSTKKSAARTKKPAAKKKSSKPAKKATKKPLTKVAEKSPAKKKSSKKQPVKQPITVVESYSSDPPKKAKKPAATKSTKSAKAEKQDGDAFSEMQSAYLDRVWDVLNKLGTSDIDAVAGELNMMPQPVGLALGQLVQLGRATFEGISRKWTAVQPVAAATSPVFDGGHTLESILDRGAKTSKDIGALLGISTDAAGALLRRRIKKGEVRKVGELYERVGKAADAKADEQFMSPEPLGEDDAAINDAFEQELRDKGRKRNERRERFRGDEPIDELAAGEKAVFEERLLDEQIAASRGETSTAVVVDRRTTSKVGAANGRRPK